MTSDLERPLSFAEKQYLRQVGPAVARITHIVSHFISLMIIAMLGFPAFLLSRDVPLLASAFALVAAIAVLMKARSVARTLRFKSSTRGMQDWTPVIITGSLRIETLGSGKFTWRQTYIGFSPVSVPQHWRTTLKRIVRPMRFRGALPPASGDETVDFLTPCQLLETENGLSVDLEHARISSRRPNANYWAPAGLTGLGALTFALLFAAMEHNVDVATSIQAIRSAFSAPTIYDSGDALGGAEPAIGPVVLRNAWILPTANLEGSPAEAEYAIVRTATRDRLLQETASETTAQPAQMVRQRLAATEIVGYLKRVGNVFPHYEFDPTFSGLREPHAVERELLSTQRPYMLITPYDTRMLREDAYWLFGGLSCLLGFLLLAWRTGRGFLQQRKFAREAKAVYAKAGIDLEL